MTLAHARPGIGFPRSAGVLRLSGVLFTPRDPAADLIDALQGFRTDRITVERLGEVLRGTALFTPVSDEDGGVAVLTARDGELSWLGAFTTEARMAEFYRQSGRGADAVRYAELTGVELLDQVLPALPRGTGLVIDAGTEHSTALGPVTGLVPDEIALTESGK
ncbi:SseB protein N-terminal domain-containing protein [Saccharopolyspora antimicrobica]|uniref:SseB protein N-terminal domain-containing protein n=1 Tax=Saccharopolyspora antimicrobica TaxID=455193 RepID=A0A1I4T5B2_9PSEU|nr:type III secretion system (T3SS) SseB-like protein [Saccharopolyspora antimicrobica]SFM71803.1 SseB protein N-terminal domain-containing protein [Saccharopolyspora antimicrobica]